jgi:3-hydroxyanthranilate 3,4-dioxygenase
MNELKTVDLSGVMDALKTAAKPVSVLWQEADSLIFVARGRADRSEFHVDPSDEVMYVLAGEMHLHIINREGKREIAHLRQGEIVHCPAGTPHSPRMAVDARLLVMERKRRAGEVDRFLWFCEHCDTKLYETTRIVADYAQDPVSSVYREFYASEAHRTCTACGYVAAVPQGVLAPT